MSAATTTAAKRAQPLDMSFVTRRPSARAVVATFGCLLSVDVATVAWLPTLLAGLLSAGPHIRDRGNSRPPCGPAHHRSFRHQGERR